MGLAPQLQGPMSRVNAKRMVAHLPWVRTLASGDEKISHNPDKERSRTDEMILHDQKNVHSENMKKKI